MAPEPISDWAPIAVVQQHKRAWDPRSDPATLAALLINPVFAVRAAAFFNPSTPLPALLQFTQQYQQWRSYRYDTYCAKEPDGPLVASFCWSADDYPKKPPLVTAFRCLSRKIVSGPQHLAARINPDHTIQLEPGSIAAQTRER